ncbi:hypothetical protein K443DRAFT_4618 [Laccaria amethystina LaAM-08-1]|uniref:Uncharacterized protein n=1 Tax=Laccaria amethystina LaAM-08-1 TaxID=1095629 RepID=A0A0C9Y313_9AGAR|nr:hypothetical protein K443DRAFT_4618 [Laccaria amethystina LaAM-08-1]
MPSTPSAAAMTTTTNDDGWEVREEDGLPKVAVAHTRCHVTTPNCPQPPLTPKRQRQRGNTMPPAQRMTTLDGESPHQPMAERRRTVSYRRPPLVSAAPL